MDYMPRIVDDELARRLARTGAVYVRGPKWCGKTSTCEQVAASVLRMRDPDSYASNMEAAAIRPSLLLRVCLVKSCFRKRASLSFGFRHASFSVFGAGTPLAS